MTRCSPARPAVERELAEQLTSAFVGKLARRAAVKVEQVEREEGGRCSLGVAARFVARGAQPLPEAGEVRTAIGAQADELAVDQYAVATERLPDGGEFWELLGAVASRARAQTRRAPVATQLNAHSVELHLDRPAAADRHRPATRQHRGDEPRKLLSRAHAASVREAGSRGAPPSGRRDRPRREVARHPRALI